VKHTTLNDDLDNLFCKYKKDQANLCPKCTS